MHFLGAQRLPSVRKVLEKGSRVSFITEARTADIILEGVLYLWGTSPFGI